MNCGCPGTSMNRAWHSQAHQDETVASFLQGARDGYFVDLAASSPTLYSNSRALEEQYGWRGVCIDALDHSRILFASSNRSCTFVQALVGDEGGRRVLFRQIIGGHARGGKLYMLSGIVENSTQPTCWANGRFCLSIEQLMARGARLDHRLMLVRTLDEILRTVGAPSTVDYLSLDVEGFETAALRGLGTDFAVRVLSVERPDSDAKRLLRARGMRRVCEERMVADMDEMYALPDVKGPCRTFLPLEWLYNATRRARVARPHIPSHHDTSSGDRRRNSQKQK
jgi:hypothetical protein